MRLITLVLLAALARLPAWGQTVPAPRQPLPVAEMQAFAATYGVLLEQFVRPLDGAELVRAALQGMLREIDPDGGEYLTEQEFRALYRAPAAGTGSVGLDLLRRDGALLIIPQAGSAAEAAGLRTGDLLRTLDGAPVAARTVTQVMALLRGPLGSAVTLGVHRPRDDSARTVVLRRETIEAPAATLSALSGPPRQLPLQLLRLPALAPAQLQAAFDLLRQAWQRERFHGLVLDLRGNQGGALESAIALAAAFLPRDTPIATISGRAAGEGRRYRATPADYARGVVDDPATLLPAALRQLPLVVLVDERTAAGAEIAVAAWRDAGRATVVGRPTFGRGSIQTVTPLPGAGAIKYTTGHWVSPAGQPLDGRPLQPDRHVEPPDGTADLAAALQAISALLERPTR